MLAEMIILPISAGKKLMPDEIGRIITMISNSIKMWHKVENTRFNQKSRNAVNLGPNIH